MLEARESCVFRQVLLAYNSNFKQEDVLKGMIASCMGKDALTCSVEKLVQGEMDNCTVKQLTR